jgi:8-oxo-dGTP pyrophosphatase MutT (NUDIX family)
MENYPALSTKYAGSRISSVGVLIHTGRRLDNTEDPWFILVEQKDQPEESHLQIKPFGIPAGRAEKFESHPIQTAVREVYEETGLEFDWRRLTLFTVRPKKSGDLSSIRIVYSCAIPWEVIRFMADWQLVEEGLYLAPRGYGNQDEIGQLALVSRDKLFRRVVGRLAYYRWDLTRGIQERLESLNII